MSIEFQIVVQLLISQLVVVGTPAYFYHMTINIKRTFFFNGISLSKTSLNVVSYCDTVLKYVHAEITMQQQSTETLYV